MMDVVIEVVFALVFCCGFVAGFFVGMFIAFRKCYCILANVKSRLEDLLKYLKGGRHE